MTNKVKPPEPKSAEEIERISNLPESDDEANDPAFSTRDLIAPQVYGDSKFVEIECGYAFQVDKDVDEHFILEQVQAACIQVGLKPDYTRLKKSGSYATMGDQQIAVLRMIADDNDGHAAQVIENAADTIVELQRQLAAAKTKH